MKSSICLLVVVLALATDMCASCGPNNRCTIFGGCSDNEYCYQSHCRPKRGRLGSCIPAFQATQCTGDLSCTCNPKLCNSAAIIGELGSGIGGLGIPNLGDAISSCCRCAWGAGAGIIAVDNGSEKLAVLASLNGNKTNEILKMFRWITREVSSPRDFLPVFIVSRYIPLRSWIKSITEFCTSVTGGA